MSLRLPIVLAATLLTLAPPPAAAEQRAGASAATSSVERAAAMPTLSISPEVAAKVGHQVFLNETGGDKKAITSWNRHEAFASLGIGHFLWFPAGSTAPFDESFPPMLQFMRDRGAKLPAWLDKTPIPPCPWNDKAEFDREFNAPKLTELRAFLLDTVGIQAQFLVARMQGALDKILAATADPAQREHVRAQFARVARASTDLYPLIDYINFKGEGIKPEETAPDQQTGKREGWGLRQVLLQMTGNANDTDTVLAEFAEASAAVLKRRVRNIPANAEWLPGWLKRVETYRRAVG